MKKIKNENQILNKIHEYLKIEDIGDVISDIADLIMRLNLGQMSLVIGILEKYCKLRYDSRGPDIEGTLYKAKELGEYIKCYQQYTNCEYIQSGECWPTRKGFCPKKKEQKSTTHDVKNYHSICCNAKVKIIGPTPDFIGDKNPKIGTCYFECTKCGEPCDVKEWGKK